MKKETALNFYGGKVVDVAAALGITKQAVSKWGPVIPKPSARELQFITGGQIVVDESLYVKVKK